MSRAIYIPSAGRANRQHTFQRIPDEFKDITNVVVPMSEWKAYERTVGKAHLLGCPTTGIGSTRQWILENTEADYVLMLDDDMYFYHRKAKGDWHLATNDAEDNVRMLARLFRLMEDKNYAHVGMATRTEAARYLCGIRTCTRVNNVHGFDVKKVLHAQRKFDCRFDKLKLMEDFHFTLTMLEHGYANALLLDYVWNQPGSNTDGGCSAYRTAKLQAECAHALAALHPKTVTVVTKKVKGTGSWKDMTERTDVRIQWKQAYLQSGNGPHKHWHKETKNGG